MQLKGFGKVSKGQDWGRGAQNLQHVKAFLAFLHPLNFSFLMNCSVARKLIIEGASNFVITLNEASIVVCEPQEAPLFCNHDGNWPVLGSFDFITICLDALFGNLMPKINYTGFEELAHSGLQLLSSHLQP